MEKFDILCDSNNKTFWERQNKGMSKKITGYQWWGEMKRRNREDFQGNETTLSYIIMTDTSNHLFVQTHRMHNTKSELQSKLWT